MKTNQFKKAASYCNIGLIIFTLALLGAAMAYFIEVSGLPQAESNLLFIKPCYYVVMLCSILIIAKEIRKFWAALKNKTTKADDPAEEIDDAVTVSKKTDTIKQFLDEHKEIVLIVFSFLYLGILKTLGYVFSTFFFLSAVLYLIGAFNKKLVIIVSALTVLILYVAFGVCLRVSLPKGILGF
ncbi:MAG: tripartite tricarboxylate transporter TctB family protein [Holosporales bacterium]|jgi:hypothetical protein|nr:tripartite tricarboxylate transporter TctB family protein [Holosporales bacterium]